MTTPPGPPHGQPGASFGPPPYGPPNSPYPPAPQTPAPRTPPVQFGPPGAQYGAPPNYGWYPPPPPPRGPRNGKTAWIVAGIIVALMLTVGGGTVIWKAVHHKPPADQPSVAGPSRAPVTAQMGSLLLTREQLYPILYPEGKPDPGWPDPLMPKPINEQTSPAQCTSAVIVGSAMEYPPNTYDDFAMRLAWIGIGTASQTAVRFDSAEQASTFRDRQIDIWKQCSGTTATVAVKGIADPQVHIGNLDSAGGITTLEVKRGHLGQPCQRAMTAVSNVVIEAETCTPDHPTLGTHKTARDVVNDIVARIH